MAPVFLHIGLPKTGTTSIQHFLSKNRRMLARRGFIVPMTPGDPNHQKITIYAMDNKKKLPIRLVHGLNSAAAIADFRSSFPAALRDEATGWGARDAIILSGEHMSRLEEPAEFDKLKQLLAVGGERPVRVIVYLRRQDLYCLSDYAQRIKTGEFGPWASLPDDASSPRFDYEAILGCWAAAFGRDNICVRVFERAQLSGGDLIADFMNLIGCDHGPDFRPPIRKNESLDAKTLAFLALINPWYPRFRDGRVNPDRKDLVAAVQKMADGGCGGSGLRFAPEVAKSLLARFKESNARIARNYLGRADGRLFYEDPADEPECAPHLSPDEYGEMVVRLWSHVQGTALPARRVPRG